MGEGGRVPTGVEYDEDFKCMHVNDHPHLLYLNDSAADMDHILAVV